MRLTFPRSRRLLTAQEFNQVFKQPIKAPGPTLILLARPNSLTYPRLGLAITKKAHKRAVERNRIRRIIRESFRSHQERLPGLDIVAVSRKGGREQEVERLQQCLEQQWLKLIKQFNGLS